MSGFEDLGFQEHGAPEHFDDLGFVPHAQQAQAAAPQSFLDREVPVVGGTPRGYIQGALNALPSAGMVVGGSLGAAGAAAAAFPETLGIGSIPAGVVGGASGAAVGGGLGQALKDAGELHILGKQKTGGELLRNTALAIPESAIGEIGGQAAGKAIEAAAAPIAKMATKAGETLTGIPEKVIQSYAKRADTINALAKSSDGDAQEAADQLRQQFMDSIKSKRLTLNGQISDTLAGRAGQSIESQPIVDVLNAQKARLNPNLRADEIKQIDGLIAKVTSVSKDGRIGLRDAHDLKEVLQETAAPSYKPGVFQAGEKVQQAAKSGAAVARQAIETEAPEIAEANAQLSQLHQISRNGNKNLFTPGKPASALMTAGSGVNPQNVATLQKMGDMVGHPMLQGAEDLNAMRTFGNPAYMPVDSTGKAVGRMGAGSVLGGIVGYEAGGKEGAIAGSLAGGAMTSPAALKMAINTGRAAAPAAPALAPLGSALTKAALQPSMGRDGVAPAQGTMGPADLRQTQVPTKGPDKWANDGFDKLIAHAKDAETKAMLTKARGDLMQSPRMKELLIQASDLKPGTTAMTDVLKKIKGGK